MLMGKLQSAGLTKSEIPVVELVIQGLRSKEVAALLFVTEKTVKFHLTNIYKRLGINNRSQLILWCVPHLSFKLATIDTNGNTMLPGHNLYITDKSGNA